MIDVLKKTLEVGLGAAAMTQEKFPSLRPNLKKKAQKRKQKRSRGLKGNLL